MTLTKPNPVFKVTPLDVRCSYVISKLLTLLNYWCHDGLMMCRPVIRRLPLAIQRCPVV